MTTISPISAKPVRPDWKPRVFLIDVDGVMTNGQFLYSAEGKAFKAFGPDDHDALLLLKPYLEVRFITGDRKGLAITQRRIEVDMKMPLDLVSTVRRLEWMRERFDPGDVVYMGDGIFDPFVFAGVGYGICPANGFHLTKARAHYVTVAQGGDRAVAEACLHLLDKFFVPFDPDKLPEKFSSSGEWGV